MSWQALLLQGIYSIAELLFLFFGAFQNRLRMNRGAVIAVLLGVSAGCAAIFLVATSIFQISFEENYFLVNMASVAVFLILSIILVRSPKPQVVFLVFLFGGYSDCTLLFANTLEHGIFPESWNVFPKATYMYTLGIIIAVSFPFMRMFSTHFLRPILEATEGLMFWRYLWLLPGSFSMIYHFAVRSHYTAPYEMWTMGEYFLPYAWTAGVFLSYYVIVKMLAQTAKNSQLSEKLHIVEIRTAYQQDLYQHTQENIAQTRRMRHDLRHHLLVLQKLAEEQNISEFQKYLAQYLETLDMQKGQELCENQAVNAVAGHFLTQANQEGIQTEAQVEFPASLPLLESDLCMLLANLLENALEACRRQIDGKERKLRIQARLLPGQQIQMKVANTYSGEVHIENGAFLSTKHGGLGIGTESVCCLAEKYGGSAEFHHWNGWFEVDVALPVVEVAVH